LPSVLTITNVISRGQIVTQDISLSGNEKFFKDDEIIVSKTNLKGHLTYVNRLFLDISGYTEKEVLGKPHNVIRHPDMPRCIFKMLWHTLSHGQEIFAYVVNRCKNGDHYWVYAHVTPSRDTSGKIVGYHSNRRVPQASIIQDAIIPLYKQLKVAEDQQQNRKDGLNRSSQLVSAMLAEKGLAYDEYIMTIGQDKRRGYR